MIRNRRRYTSQQFTTLEELEQQITVIRANAEKEVEKATRALAVQVAVTKELNLTGENWSAGFMHTAYADCHIHFEVETLHEALVLAERLGTAHTMETIFMVRDGCTGFKPESRVKEKEWERGNNPDIQAEVRNVGGWIYRVEVCPGYGPQNELRFFLNLDCGHLVEVRVFVLADPDTYISYQAPDPQHRCDGQVMQKHGFDRLVNNSGHFTSEIAYWSPPGVPKQRVLYN